MKPIVKGGSNQTSLEVCCLAGQVPTPETLRVTRCTSANEKHLMEAYGMGTIPSLQVHEDKH